MLTLDDAIENPADALEVRIDCKELTALPERLFELTNLESLRLSDVPAEFEVSEQAGTLTKLCKLDITGPEDGSLAFPAAFFACPITDLEIRKIRVREVAEFGERLTRFRMASHFIYEDILPLTKAFPNLEYLEIWGYHGKNAQGNVQAFELPPEIEKLSKLTEIRLVSAAMQKLPDEFAALTNLTVARIRNHHFGAFPKQLTQLPNLETLDFSSNKKLVRIGPEVEAMAALRVFNMAGCWNGGALPLRFEEPKLQPMPKHIAKFPALEELDVSHCGVTEAGPIAELTTLKKLSIEWGAIEDLEPLTALSELEDLNLYHCWVSDISPVAKFSKLRRLNVASTDVKDLSPLVACTELEYLKIEGSKADDNPARALEPLIGLEKLVEIESDELKEGMWEKLKGGESISADAIVLQLESGDAAQVVEALKSIISYSADRSSDDMNALLEFFDLDEDMFHEPEVVEFEPLDNALDAHGSEIPSDVLAGLVGATFVSTYDGWEATVKATQLLIERRDVEAQTKVIDAFVNAMEYYDAGHRWWEDSVQDQFIDDLLPEFAAPALAQLMPHLGGDHLNPEYGDCMQELYVPAFEGLDEPDESLMASFREYIMDQTEESYGSDPGSAQDLVDRALSASKGAVADQLQALKDAHLAAVAENSDEPEEPEEALDASDDEEPKQMYGRTVRKVAKKTATVADDHQHVSPSDIGTALQDAFGEPGVDALVAALAEIPKVTNAKVAEFAAAFTNNKLIECLQGADLESGITLAKAYAEIAPDVGWAEGNMQSNIASNTLVLAVHSGSYEIEQLVFDHLMPKRISHTTLAFNVACFWATKGDKDKMCDAIRDAIGLGKRPEQFKSDSDFAPYLEDQDFLSALEG